MLLFYLPRELYCVSTLYHLILKVNLLSFIGNRDVLATHGPFEQRHSIHQERLLYHGFLVFFTLLLGLCTIFKLGAVFIPTLYVGGMVIGASYDLLTKDSEPMSQWCYLLPATVIIPSMISLFYGFLEVFVPLVGRTGVSNMADVIVGILSGLIVFFLISIFLPLLYRMSDGRLANTFLVVLACLGISILIFSRIYHQPFSMDRPKRVYIQYLHNMTDGERSLHLTRVDQVEMPTLIEQLSYVANSIPEKEMPDDMIHSLGVFHPFGYFL
jgi:hypothetical protein